MAFDEVTRAYNEIIFEYTYRAKCREHLFDKALIVQMKTSISFLGEPPRKVSRFFTEHCRCRLLVVMRRAGARENDSRAYTYIYI